MNQDVFKGKWLQIRGEIKRKWGRITDDELDEAEGNAEKLVGRIQEEYGQSREQVERELEEMSRRA